jgi:4-amino-4-deoxy-L-arabinose transferase-like glycosyltransferase
MLASSRPIRLAIYGLLAAILYLPSLGRPALWEPDEGRYAEIAREMVVSGDYVTPRDDFELYFEKPPLVYWANAASIKIFGVNEFAVRLPAALFSIGQVVVTAALVEGMFGGLPGFFAALVLALTPLFYGFAKFATLDPAIAFFLTAALAAFYIAARDGPFSRRTARNWMLLSAAMLALGTLAKGPIALLLGGAIALAWLALEHRLREIAQMPLVLCGVVYAAIVLPWFILMEARNPGFVSFFFIHEHLERYVASTEHGWGPWFFLPIVIGGAWPWIFFVPLGWSAMRAEDGLLGWPRYARESHAFARFLAIWFVVILVFFSIPRSKLGSYILPALPPLAIVAGCGLVRLFLMAPGERRPILHWFLRVNFALAAVAIALLWILVRPIDIKLADDGILCAILLAAAALGLDLVGNSQQYVFAAIIFFALMMIMVDGVSRFARDDVAPRVTYRNLARAVEPYLVGDCALASYRHYVQSLPFYTRSRETRVEYWGELSEVAPQAAGKSPFLIGSDARLRQAWSSGSCMVLIANARDLKGLEDALKPAPVVIGCEGKKFALYNGALAPPPAAVDCLNFTQKNQ